MKMNSENIGFVVLVVILVSIPLFSLEIEKVTGVNYMYICAVSSGLLGVVLVWIDKNKNRKARNDGHL